MADLSDVETGIVNIIAAAVYPNGVAQPSTTGSAVKIFPGWPNEVAMDADLAAGIVSISVFAPPSMERVTTRYPKAWQVLSVTAPVIAATVSGSKVTIGGSARALDLIALVVANKAYGYAVLGTDTPSSVAAALAALLAVDMTVSVAGPVITLPATKSGRISARTGAPNIIARELRRQQRGFMISIWAPTPALRASTAAVVDTILSGTDTFTLPDGFGCWLTYRSSDDQDKKQTALEYRRNINFWAEYPTTESSTANPVLAFISSLAVPPPPAPPIASPAVADATPAITNAN